MRKVLYILSFILFLSCSHHQNAEMFLEKAQAVMETSPDSAIMYLDSILIPEKFLKKDRYMEYLVTKVQAKYKNYDNIKYDTNIFETKKLLIFGQGLSVSEHSAPSSFMERIC